MIGQTFQTKHCGPATVAAYKNRDNVWVVFTNTGHTLKTTKARLVKSDRPALRDPLAPSVFGVGCIGTGEHKAHHKGADTKPYQTWRAMMRRCYYRSAKHHQPSYEGVTVCDAWRNFQAFATWYAEHYPTDGGSYQLDKDARDISAKCYSPETCAFVTQRENLAARTRAGRHAVSR